MQMHDNSTQLQHHGIKGMKWGVRRFQRKDGSLTPAGEKRVAALEAKRTREVLKDKQVARKLTIQKAKQQMKDDSLDRENARKNATRESKAKVAAERAKAKNAVDDQEMYDLPDDSEQSKKNRETGKRLLVGAIAVVGTVAAVYAIKKIREKAGAKAPEDSVKDAIENVSMSKADRKRVNYIRKMADKKHAAAAKAAAQATKQRSSQEKMYAKMFDKIAKQDSRQQQAAYRASLKATKAARKAAEQATKNAVASVASTVPTATAASTGKKAAGAAIKNLAKYMFTKDLGM